MASRRGLRGFSEIVQEAIDVFLGEEQRVRVAEALALEGALSEGEAEELNRRIAVAWSTWTPTS